MDKDKDIKRISITIPSRLLKQFDSIISERGYTNRSEAVRDIIRDDLVGEEWSKSDNEVIGTITLVYDHHETGVLDRLAKTQHLHTDIIVSTMHVHIDHDNCVETLIVKGAAQDVKKISDKLISERGVKHGKIVFTTTGSNLV